MSLYLHGCKLCATKSIDIKMEIWTSNAIYTYSTARMFYKFFTYDPLEIR